MTTDTTKTRTPPRGWLATRWLRFALAVTFLTRLPLPVRGEVTAEDMRASMGWYPLVGLGLGWGGYLLYALGTQYLPATVTAALVIVLLEMCTGALHLDGFMDTCDGLGSGAPRERALEIMKDSRVGAMGVFGAVGVLLVKVTALASLAPYQALLPLLAGWAAARAVPAWDVAVFPYARDAGTGKAFTGGASRWMLLAATATALAVGWWIGGVHGLALVVALIAFTLFVHTLIARRLGGLTGDVYGMGIELAETAALVAACVLAARWY